MGEFYEDEGTLKSYYLLMGESYRNITCKDLNDVSNFIRLGIHKEVIEQDELEGVLKYVDGAIALENKHTYSSYTHTVHVDGRS